MAFHYTPWVDGTTTYCAEDMNAPLDQLDIVLNMVSGEAVRMSGEVASVSGEYQGHSELGSHDFHTILSQETGTPDGADELLIYDDSAGSYKRVLRYDLMDTGQTYGLGIYDIGVSISGKPTDGQIVCTYPVPRAIRFPAGGGLTQAKAGTGAAGSPVFSLKKNGVQFATVTFSGTSGSYSGDQSDFSAGQVFTLVAPASADATLADIGFAIAAVRM